MSSMMSPKHVQTQFLYIPDLSQKCLFCSIAKQSWHTSPPHFSVSIELKSSITNASNSPVFASTLKLSAQTNKDEVPVGQLQRPVHELWRFNLLLPELPQLLHPILMKNVFNTWKLVLSENRRSCFFWIPHFMWIKSVIFFLCARIWKPTVCLAIDSDLACISLLSAPHPFFEVFHTCFVLLHFFSEF